MNVAILADLTSLMTIDWKLIGQIAAGIGGALGAVWTGIKYFNWVSRRNRIRWKKTMRGNTTVKRMLQEFVYRHPYACKAAVLYLENGGGIPYVGAQLYSSIFTDVSEAGVPEYADKWQKVRVDDEFLLMLTKVQTKGVVEIKDVKMLPPGAVKDSSEAEGVVAFDLHFLKATKNKWFYLAVSHCSHDDHETASYRDDVRVMVHSLRDIIG